MSLQDWMKRDALPLWLDVGVDHTYGGFHEAIGLDGNAVSLFRRARVICRQIYVFALAHRLGQAAGAHAATVQGLTFLKARFLRPDGTIWARLSPNGDVADPGLSLYDQAFLLFALAACAEIDLERDDCTRRALQVVEALNRDWANPAGGYIEREGEAYQANAHMHLFEASLAWEALDPLGPWTALADSIGERALTKFIDPASGALREFFNADWSMAETEAGRLIEPGHLFEWAWLLARWSHLRQRQDALVAAKRMFSVASRHGVDRVRGVTINELWDDLSVRSGRARLWPQTEWLKASVRLGSMSEGPEAESYASEAQAAAWGLGLYFDTKIPGLWRDKMLEDGGFIDEPAPASSFYHIACALDEAQSFGVAV